MDDVYDMILVATAFACGLIVYACLYTLPYLIGSVMAQTVQQMAGEVVAQ